MSDHMLKLTSADSPLRIATLAVPGGGVIGMTICPGKHAPTSIGGHGWARSLTEDVAAIKAWGALTIVTLMESWELDHYDVTLLGDVVQDYGMRWLHLPIVDGAAPTSEWDRLWLRHGRFLHECLDHGEALLIHCLGGRGRTGTVAARLLIERGIPTEEAIATVRQAREGAIETSDQLAHLLALRK